MSRKPYFIPLGFGIRLREFLQFSSILFGNGSERRRPEH